MANQYGSSFLRLRFKIILVILGALVLTIFCLPYPLAPPGPAYWQSNLEYEDYEQIIENTSELIEMGEEADYYAEARLYRGLARLKLGDLEGAKEDLTIAEELIDELKTVDPEEEKVLLYRGLMVLYAQLKDIERAEIYLELALEFAPLEKREEILKEYDDAIQP